MKTIYSQVARINETAGKSLTADRELLLKQCSIIQSELNETMQALLRKDIKEFRDGVSDIEFTSLGLFALSPFKYEQDMQTVCDSNLEKFDLTEEDALKTRAKYAAIGIETYFVVRASDSGEVYYVTRSSRDQLDANGKAYPADKWLKSHKWSEPVYLPVTRVPDYDVDAYMKEFEQELPDDVHNEYAAQSLIAMHVEKSGGARILELIELGLEAESKAEQPLLMSVTNPTGWKLEELLETIRTELAGMNTALKDKRYSLPASEIGQTKDVVMQRAYRNNSDILELLARAVILQKNTMESFDALGKDQGPTGTARV